MSKNEICVRVEVRADGSTAFSLEKDGVCKSASFGKAHSSFTDSSAGFGMGGMGITSNVRHLARECRKELRNTIDLLDMP